ncbi:hypothetical protein BDV28DRAFT_128271 [Aspergillus coremiiformis]|uniref:Uncharacterized protein n=1 Tax=Aspergillus coremiiformis TaxID=138285 RepID=A0A5N6ZG20_9EURO|nr:hypothetical protein BDV28DRAFT_128271 [Aspergillus coremiiformis]
MNRIWIWGFTGCLFVFVVWVRCFGSRGEGGSVVSFSWIGLSMAIDIRWLVILQFLLGICQLWEVRRTLLSMSWFFSMALIRGGSMVLCFSRAVLYTVVGRLFTCLVSYSILDWRLVALEI